MARMDLRVRLGLWIGPCQDCIDLERYGLDLLRKKGYTLTEDGCAYIARQQSNPRRPNRCSRCNPRSNLYQNETGGRFPGGAAAPVLCPLFGRTARKRRTS